MLRLGLCLVGWLEKDFIVLNAVAQDLGFIIQDSRFKIETYENAF